jgi:heat shock protein HslJ
MCRAGGASEPNFGTTQSVRVRQPGCRRCEPRHSRQRGGSGFGGRESIGQRHAGWLTRRKPGCSCGPAEPFGRRAHWRGRIIGTWQWQATQASNGSSTVVADPTRYTINFQADNSLQIRADCNQVGGTYSASGSSLMLQLGPSTLAACPPDSQADQFLAGLGQVTNYTVTSNNLELGLQGGGDMHFSAMPAPSLVGPNWQLLAYNNGRNAVQSVMIGTQPTAMFGTDGQVTGSGGCNTFSGPYQSTASTLSIGPLSSTRTACEQPVMDQETAYLAALERSATYRFENGRLMLADASGATQADFTR